VAAVVVLVLLLGAGAWLWLRSDGGGTSTTAANPGDTAPPAAPADSPRAAADLPELTASDSLVRRLVADLSSRPELAEWLVTDDLVRRFVGAVVTVAAGTSPRDELEVLEPEGEFRVRETDDGPVVDTASYRRYDPVVETFVSLDTEGTARLYRRLRPLFQEAYRDLGFSRGHFDGTMARAVETLLAVPAPDGPVELAPTGGTAWEYRDPDLEDLSPAQKHLLRTGPENVRRVQAKLRELAEAMELPTLPARSRGDTAG
jgi:hypothetical protein